MRRPLAFGPLAPFAFVLSVTTLACAPHPQKPAPSVAADPDAPATETWQSRHARGTSIAAHPATSVAPNRPMSASDNTTTLIERVDIAPDLTALVARAKTAPATSDTPTDRVPGVVLIPSANDDLAASLSAFAVAGFIAIAPLSAHAGEQFGEVDDVKRAARFLAEEGDVDVEHLYAFGDGAIACQSALDPDSPFRAIGALGATTTATFADMPVDERIARALLPHAAEVSTRLIVYAPDDDKAAAAVHARNPKIELDASTNPFTAFRTLIERDTSASSTSKPVAMR